MAPIDGQTGIVFHRAIDVKKNLHIFHPDSGVQVLGFKIPNWQGVLELVKAAALEQEKIKFTAWDIAIRDDYQPIIIEGNYNNPSTTFHQIPVYEGYRHVYERLLREA